jgi:hypothetical protein
MTPDTLLSGVLGGVAGSLFATLLGYYATVAAARRASYGAAGVRLVTLWRRGGADGPDAIRAELAGLAIDGNCDIHAEIEAVHDALLNGRDVPARLTLLLDKMRKTSAFRDVREAVLGRDRRQTALFEKLLRS